MHWNRPRECLSTIAALRAQGVSVQLTIIDNHSSAESLKALEDGLEVDVELVKLPENVGWGRAHNIVLRRWIEEERSPFCLISAHDALPNENCLARLIEALEAHPAWGMVCPEYGKAEVPTYGIVRGARLRAVPSRCRGTPEEVSYCHGTLAIFRRDCLYDIGIYDERYFAYGDETEIGIRARRQGWKVGMVWGAVVVNPGSWSGSNVIGYLWTRNSLRLARTCGGVYGLSLRLFYVVAVTCILWLAHASADGLSSPMARWLAIRDYLKGYCGGPPPTLVPNKQSLL